MPMAGKDAALPGTATRLPGRSRGRGLLGGRGAGPAPGAVPTRLDAAQDLTSAAARADSGPVEAACARDAGDRPPAVSRAYGLCVVARVSGRRRRWAGVALAALVVAAAGLLAFAVFYLVDFALLGVSAAVNIAVIAAAAWWAFTTRRVWKRRLNLVLAVVAGLLLVADVLWFGVRHVAGVLALLAVAGLYVWAARRALDATSDPPAGDAPAPARPWLLVNPGSGGGKAMTLDLAGVARGRGVAVHVLTRGDDPAALARAAVDGGADAVGVAGGDGSLGPVAAVAAGAGVPFFCVPTGTRNHFAHDLGLDRGAPLTALDALNAEAGTERRIDLAAVGEHPFVNNVSLGAYADMVHEPGYRERKGATAHAVLPAGLRGAPVAQPVSVRDPDGRLHSGPLVLLVANNPYELRDPLRLGVRERLDGGMLQVSALYPASGQGAALARLVGRLLSGREPEGGQWAQWTAPDVLVEAPADTVKAGLDGEAVELPAPLDFRVLPGALRVRVPRSALPPAAAEARLYRPATVRRMWTVLRGDAG